MPREFRRCCVCVTSPRRALPRFPSPSHQKLTPSMCGICGIVGGNDHLLVERMTALMRHRGPDGGGTRFFPPTDSAPPAALGHRRLSILDPTPRAAQPMADSTGRFWITFNGEIYNYRELRRHVEASGHQFTTDSDTEVLVELYARRGQSILTQLNGMFAFAVWDSCRGELFMARDRLGVKPLYYSLADDKLHFASEIKALLVGLPPPSLRTDVLGDYLTFLWVPDPDTLFEGIFKLPAGHCATHRAGRLSIRQYWDMTFAPENRPESEWADHVRGTVQESVRRQMVSDVPIGSFLSGGIDSSAIVAEMSRHGGPATTYTVGFSQKDLKHDIVPDDVHYSRQVADLFRVDYHERLLVPDVVDLLPRLVWHMDEPVADPAAISTYLICSAAHERVTVVLSGMGGDEIFAGYPRHLAAQIAGIADVLPQSMRRVIRSGVSARLTLGHPGRMRGPRRNLAKFLRGVDLSPHDRYLAYCSYYQADELSRLLHPDVADVVLDPFRRHRTYFDRVRHEHWLNQLIYIDLKTFLPCLNLTYTDKMSMAASTEVRVPLLDDALVSLSGRIPPDLKLHWLTRKYVFKRSMEGILPPQVIWRRKAGFGAPVRSWLVGELHPMLDDLLSPSAVLARGLLNPGEVQRLRLANDASREDNALRLWALVTLELWLQEFVDGGRQYHRQAAMAR
jgi:asparagine synthase (glutamine-hydrolysing)